MKGTICCVDGACRLPDAKWHGTAGGYSNHRCRCAECRRAWAEYFRSGTGRDSVARYRARLRAAGLTVSSSWTRPVPRVRPFVKRVRDGAQ